MKKIFLFLLSVFFVFNSSLFSQYKSRWDAVPKEIKDTKQYKRFEWFHKQRAYPNDTIPKIHYIKVLEEEKQKIAGRLRKTTDMEWELMGPKGAQAFNHWGTVSGKVNGLAIHPTDSLTLYIGAASGGIWKTTNGGESWSDLGSDLPSLTYGAVAIDPNNPDIVYAGSGEAILFATAYHTEDSRGLYKSIDGGQNWIQITDGFGINTIFGDLEVSPYNSNIVLGALASGGFFRFNANFPNEGIWKSSDEGMHWTRTLNVDDAYDVLFHPTDTNLVYAGIGGAKSNSGFYISTDQGDTWTQSNTGLQAANTIGRIQIDISRSNPEILYAVIFKGPNPNPVMGTTKGYKSTDGGNSWSQIASGQHLGGYSAWNATWFDQGYIDLCIAVDPIDENHVFIGNIELHETFNGNDFQPRRVGGNDATASIAHYDYHKLVFSPSNPSYLYIGCDGGVYKSEDAGLTVTSANTGLSTFQVYRVANHPSDPAIIVGGTQDNGIVKTTDNGLNWNSSFPFDGIDCFFNYGNPLYFFVASQFGNLWRSTDGGETVTLMYTVQNSVFETPFFQHPTQSNYLYSANTNIIRSTNTGTTFSTFASNVSPVPIWTLAQSSVNPDNMIFGTSFYRGMIDSTFFVKVSADEGSTWTDVTNNIPGEPRWISKVASDPIDENTMYVLRTGFSEGNKLYKTTDLGQTWINISGSLPDVPCNDIFVWPYDTDQIYLANDIGVYFTIDGGASWEYASNDIPIVPCMDFDFVHIDTTGYLRVGTFGRGIFQTLFDLSEVAGVEFTNNVPTRYSLSQNYPIPFNPATKIQYSIPVAALSTVEVQNVSLKVYDILGREVAMLVNQKQKPGNYEVTWDASNQPSGIYFYQLNTGNYMDTKKMILIR